MSALDELRQRFDSVDEARSGLIGYDGLCKLYDGAEKTDIDQLMHYLDVDGDGKFSFADLTRVYNNVEQEPNDTSSPVVLRQNKGRRRNMTVDEMDNINAAALSPIPQATSPSTRTSVQDLTIALSETNMNRASKVWSMISDSGDLPSFSSPQQDQSSPVPSFTEDEDGISSMKATLQSICGNSDVMDTEAVEKLCKYAEAAPEDEKELRALLLGLDTEKKGNVSMENFARALQAARYGAAVTSTPSPTYVARRKRFSQHSLGESFSVIPEYSTDSPRFTFSTQVVADEQPSLSVLDVDNTGYIKISSLLKRWHKMGVDITDTNKDYFERMLKMTLPIDSMGQVSVSDVTSLLESAISDDAGKHDSSLRCVALASFKHEIVNLKKHVEEVEGENIQLKQTFTKIADEKKRLIKEADQSLDCVTKASEKKLEDEKAQNNMKINEIKRTVHFQAQAKLAAYEGEIERLKVQLHGSKSKEKELSSELKDIKEELENAKEQWHKALHEVQEMEKKYAKLKGSLNVRLENTCTFDHENDLKQIKDLEVQIEQYRKINEELKEEKQAVYDKYDCLQGEYDTLKRKYYVQKEERSVKNTRKHSSAKSKGDKPISSIGLKKKQDSDSDEQEERFKEKKTTMMAATSLQKKDKDITLLKENETLKEQLKYHLKCLSEAQVSLQYQLEHYKRENSQLELLFKEAKQYDKLMAAEAEVKVENNERSRDETDKVYKLNTPQDSQFFVQETKIPHSDLEEERKNNQMLQEMLASRYKQATVDLCGYKDREEQHLQQIARLTEGNDASDDMDFPETSGEIMSQTNISPLTFNPSSYDETIAQMKSQLDAVRESLKQTKRTHETSQAQNQLIKKLYEDIATLKAIKEHEGQLHNEEKAGLECSLQTMAAKYGEELAAKNVELDDEQKKNQAILSQSEQAVLELHDYKERERQYLQQIANLKQEIESLAEVDLPDSTDESIAQASISPLTFNPSSSYDETLALMKSQLDAVRESLKHTKRTRETAQTQSQLITKLYEDMATLKAIKEHGDQIHSGVKASLESNIQSLTAKYEEELAAKIEELDNERKTNQSVLSQSEQAALELHCYIDREKQYLQQIANLKQEIESLAEVDLPDSPDESIAQANISPLTFNPSSYDETLALMKSQLDAVRESLKHTKRTRETAQTQSQLITKLYEDMATLKAIKEHGDQIHSGVKASLESNIQSLTAKYEEELAAKIEELDNERKTNQSVLSQSEQAALELHCYIDREKQYLQQIANLKQEIESLAEVDLPDSPDESIAQANISPLTFNPSSYDETLALMKSQLDAVRESLKHTKRTRETAQEQSQLITKLYEDMATLKAIREHGDQIHSGEKASLESNIQSLTAKYEEELAAKIEELDNERKNNQAVLSQSEQAALELHSYIDREKQYLEKIANLKQEIESLAEVELPDSTDESIAQASISPLTFNPSSYDETLALMKSQLDAVMESLKHTKRTHKTAREQNQLIRKLYEDIATLKAIKEHDDQLHNVEKACLESNLQTVSAKYECEFATNNAELQNERKTNQMLQSQSAQATLELSVYKEREEQYLQQIAKLNNEIKSQTEVDFFETDDELMAQANHSPPSSFCPSFYDETLALMKSQLDAVRESLKHTKRTRETAQTQSQLITKLYEDTATLKAIKEHCDQIHSGEKASLESNIQSLTAKYEKELAAKNEQLDNERKINQAVLSQSEQAALELHGYIDREKQYLQQIATLKEEIESLAEVDLPDSTDEQMAQVNISPLTFNPSSYNETLALMKSQLDAVRESLKHTKRSHESAQEQNQLIRKLYEDIATLKAIKEHDDQLHNAEKVCLESNLQIMSAKYEKQFETNNDELQNERKTNQMLQSQNAQATLELSVYKEREEQYLQQIAKLNNEIKSQTEVDFSETDDKLMAQANHSPPSTFSPSSYDETLALMKSQLDAVRESLKHTKRTRETAQEQNQLIKILHENVIILKAIKEHDDQLHNEAEATLVSSLETKTKQYGQELAEKSDELDKERKSNQMLQSQSVQTALELCEYKDREEHYLKQIAKFKEESESLANVDFLETTNACIAKTTRTFNPLHYDETLALMKSQLDAVRESLKHTKRTRETAQEQSQLIMKLYEDMATLKAIKEHCDQLASGEKASLESNIQSLTAKYEEELAAKIEELDNERKTNQSVLSQSEQAALELHGYIDREKQYLEQIANLKQEIESLTEVDSPDSTDESIAQANISPHTFNPSSYDETLALMKSQLDAVRESLKHTKRTRETAQEQTQLIRKLYEDIATLKAIKEHDDQLHNGDKACLESNLHTMSAKYESEFATNNAELQNERKTNQMLQSQSAQATLELSVYKEREEQYLQQIAKLNNEIKSQTEVDFSETNDELMAQANHSPSTFSPSSYDETLALMKSQLDAVRDSLKHTKRTSKTAQEQNQHIKKLYEDMAILKAIKEQEDQIHVKEKAGLESYLQTVSAKYEEQFAAMNDRLKERKTNEILHSQSTQTNAELPEYKDRKEQTSDHRNENTTHDEVDFCFNSGGLWPHGHLSVLTKPSTFDETLALMESRLDAVSEPLKHLKHPSDSTISQMQLIDELYEDMKTLRAFKDRSDQLHNESKAGLQSSLLSMQTKYEQEIATKNDELDSERKSNQILLTQSAQTALELHGYKDMEKQYLQQIAKLKNDNDIQTAVNIFEPTAELMAHVNISPLTFNPSSYDETLALMKSQLDAVRESLKHTKRTHETAQEQSQLITKLYKNMATLKAIKEHDDQLRNVEKAGLESRLQNMATKHEQKLAAMCDTLEDERKNTQRSNEKMQLQNTQMSVELGKYKEREEMYIQQITKLREELEAIGDIDISDVSVKPLTNANQSAKLLSSEGTLGEMRSAITKLRQSLSHAIQTSTTLKQKEKLVGKLFEDIESLKESEQLFCEEKTKLLSQIEQCNEEIFQLRENLVTLNNRCSEAADEVIKSSAMMAKDHELLLELQEKLSRKENEVQKYKDELETIKEQQSKGVIIALEAQAKEVAEAIRKDREIESLQEQLRRHNHCELDELTGEMTLVPEHWRPSKKMVEVGVATEEHHSSDNMSMHNQLYRNTLRYNTTDLMKTIQAEIMGLRTLVQHSESQFRLDVEKTASQLKECYISFQQREISSLVVQLTRQHEQEMEELQDKLALKCGSEVKNDLISMLNAKEHQLQETNGRLELTRTEHDEQLRKLEQEKQHLEELYKVECKAHNDCTKEMIQKHSFELNEAKATAELQTSNLREFCTTITNCSMEAVCDLDHTGIIDYLRCEVQRRMEQHSEAQTQAKMLAEEQTNNLRELCLETTNCSTDTLQGCSHDGLVQLIRDEMKRVHETFSKELSDAQHIAEAQTNSLRNVCVANANCSEEMVQGLDHSSLLEWIKDEIEKASDRHCNELNEAKATAELQTSHVRELCTTVTNCPIEAVSNLSYAGLLVHLKHGIQRRLEQHSEAQTQAKMLAEQQTNNLRELCLETTNCSTDTLQGCSHDGLVQLIRDKMKQVHETHSKELSNAAHIAEVQTDDLRELCSIAIGNEIGENINYLTHGDLLRYVRGELEKIKDSLLQESSRAQQLGDELTTLTRRYEGAETLLLEEHDEEVRGLLQQKDMLAYQLGTMKDHYDQLLVQSSEKEPQSELLEELQNVKAALLQSTHELDHLSLQSAELRREKDVLLDIIKQLCHQFKPIEVVI